MEIIENINMDSYRIQQTNSGKINLAGDEGRLGPIRKPDSFRSPEEELAPLSIIIQGINERFGVDFTEEDKVKHFAEDMQRRLVENKNFLEQLIQK